MAQDDWLAAQFEENRPRLRAVAHRMLGSRAEADDAVQESWLRLARSDASTIDNLGGWLTTVLARVCLDRLRARAARPEDAVGARVDDVADDVDPAAEALMAESVGAALLVVLDALPPAERVAFVLHDVFAVPFDDVATVLDRSPDAARQLASRARRRVQSSDRAASPSVDPAGQRELVDAFLRAARGGDFEGLLRVLDPEVVLAPDAAALRMGSLREMRGAPAVARALSGGARAARLAIVDGLAGLVWAPRGDVRGVMEFVVADGKIVALNVTGDAERIDAAEIVVIGD